MEKRTYIIKCLTNMHVGAGDSQVSLIDNCVQRDIITNYPVINGSSLKGALRNHFVNKKNNRVDEIFGKENSKNNHSLEGKIKFLSANLLAYPIPEKDDKVYKLVTTEKIISEFKEVIGEKFNEKINNISIDKISNLEMKKNTDKLPVIARNKLNDGLSENLWYEEVVPRYTLFYFVILAEDESIIECFEKEIEKEWIQIGANASVGYGYCTIQK